MTDMYPEPLDWHELRAQVQGRICVDGGNRRKEWLRRTEHTQRPDVWPDVVIAYQPIVNVRSGVVLAQEALARLRGGGGAAAVFGSVSPRGILALEARCREAAIRTAMLCGLTCDLSLNISPEAVSLPLIGADDTLRFANKVGFNADRLMMEITERDAIRDVAGLNEALSPLRDRGVKIALDDFGAGHSNLQAFVDLKPDLIKIDISLISDLTTCAIRQAVVQSIVECCEKLGVVVVAEGVETIEQARMLHQFGIDQMQGFLFARPEIERLPRPPRRLLSTVTERL